MFLTDQQVFKVGNLGVLLLLFLIITAVWLADINQQGPDNICSHTTTLITPMYFN
jgi:Kef-type K+ transport system membrane component KefB